MNHLDAEDLQRFCEFLYGRVGIQLGETKRYFIERRLFDRFDKTGSSSFAQYFQRLRTDPQEVSAVISAFTVGETYFYREEHQLQCLTTDILPEVIRDKRPGDKVRLWSLPCSTGEEPYSIAIWLLENWRLVDAYNVEIIGSDVDSVGLAASRIGRYGARSLNRLPAKVLHDYFDPPHHGQRAIIQDLRESVTFTEANLVDPASMQANGVFDVIFCRNVLIYFDDASRIRASRNLWACLRPGGFICLGHTESMARINDQFDLRRFPSAIVYQRPAAS
jgi:chemotaxis protein methyltransferase CheR